jgi:glucose 1-dehydrogenase
MALDNVVTFGTVNASRENGQQAAGALTTASPRWPGRLVSRRVPLSSWPEALTKTPDDV